MQSQQSAPVIMAVTTNSVHVNCVVIAVHQFCLHIGILFRYILSFFFKEDGGSLP